LKGQMKRMASALVFLGIIALISAQGPPVQPRKAKPTAEIIRDAGYECEEHWVTTEDGYILALHRIPHGINNKDENVTRPVVYVQHGILCSSTDWVIATPSKGLGYLLADAGYDVWLGNYRGNTNSRNHTTLNPDSWINHQFWQFSWDEMGHYDIPAMIGKILEVTGEEELFYVGHSMGTTAYMGPMAYWHPDIMDKVILANFMAPVAGEAGMGGPLGYIANAGWLIDDILSLLGIGEFLPSGWLMDMLANLFCKEGEATQGICENILFVLLGYDYAQANKTLLPDILEHTPAGTSTHSLLQYAQEHSSGEFKGYDWGTKKKNLQHHGTEEPPVYDLGAVTTPLALYWSDNDYFTMPEDIMTTIMGLQTVLPGMNHEIQYKKWTHTDFMWGVDADTYIYHKIIANIEFCRINDCRNL